VSASCSDPNRGAKTKKNQAKAKENEKKRPSFGFRCITVRPQREKGQRGEKTQGGRVDKTLKEISPQRQYSLTGKNRVGNANGEKKHLRKCCHRQGKCSPRGPEERTSTAQSKNPSSNFLEKKRGTKRIMLVKKSCEGKTRGTSKFKPRQKKGRKGG